MLQRLRILVKAEEKRLLKLLLAAEKDKLNNGGNGHGSHGGSGSLDFRTGGIGGNREGFNNTSPRRRFKTPRVTSRVSAAFNVNVNSSVLPGAVTGHLESSSGVGGLGVHIDNTGSIYGGAGGDLYNNNPNETTRSSIVYNPNNPRNFISYARQPNGDPRDSRERGHGKMSMSVNMSMNAVNSMSSPGSPFAGEFCRALFSRV